MILKMLGKQQASYLFEMMGNFSVGDYFKKMRCFAYEFLFSKEWIGFDLDKAYVSVHPGDTEAYRIWTEDFNFLRNVFCKQKITFGK